ncbi:MAG: type II secretion system protein GspG [Candidatus Polarisedimenticolia bacterium]
MHRPEGRRRRRVAGFTLIELLIVVAIIGLIAAIAIPNLRNAMDRAKQNRTLADIKAIGTALEQYAVDNNTYPRGLADANAATLGSYVSPLYIRNVPAGDGWNNPWHVETNASGTIYTITSYGRDGMPGPTPGGPTADLNCDIIYSNNSFYQWPQGAQQ